MGSGPATLTGESIGACAGITEDLLKKTFLVSLFLAALVVAAQERDVLFLLLKSSALLGKQNAGVYLLPTNQLLRPWGQQALFRGRPVDMTLDSSGHLLAILNSTNISIRDAGTGVETGTVRLRGASYAGIAFRPGDREVWASETTQTGPDTVLVVPISEDGKPGPPEHIALSGHAVPTGIAFSADGHTAYVALSRNNTVVFIDVDARLLTREVPVGVAPFSVAVARKSRHIFVTNRGGKRPDRGMTVAHSSGSAVRTDAKTGAAVAGSVSVLDPEGRVTREIAVGPGPSSLTLSPDEKLIAVTNGHSDSVSLVQTATYNKVDVPIPVWPEGVLGSQPTSAAFSTDGNTLYIACGGTNAVVVLDSSGRGWHSVGALPTGWFPSTVAVDKQGDLRVLNIKGVGNTSDGKGLFSVKLYEGSLLTIPKPLPAQLAAGLREVKASNEPRFEPNGGVANVSALGIRHVFLIIKENRTYDQVFGDLPQANGDPKLAIYGRDITPNQHALAENYVLLDNFYASGVLSFEGHQWLMQGFVSDYVERALLSSPRGYAWNLSDALTVSPAGFFWQGGARPLDVRLYGAISLPLRWDPETQSAIDMTEHELLSWSQYWRLYKQGKWRDAVGHRTGVPALAHLAANHYPVSSMRIPDQIRSESFLQELAEREKTGEMPNLSVLTMTSDHTMGINPDSPTPSAMVADNDLALGKIVEGISHSRFWANSLILVVEDDAQNGFDHVDGHRTVALAIGPHIRRGVVDHNNYNQTNLIRTIQEIYRIPPRTRFLKSARAMNSLFTPAQDATPYRHLVPKIALDTMNPPLKALNGRRLWAARQSAAMNWDEVDDAPAEVLNRILWWDAKGYDSKYPEAPMKATSRLTLRHHRVEND